VTYYKVLNGLRPNIADTSYRYPGVGRWTKRIDGDLVACERGYHLAQDEQVARMAGADDLRGRTWRCDRGGREQDRHRSGAADTPTRHLE
jgi:hypothetical protein